MSEDTKYPAFQKIPRLRRDVVITEKIDGTNSLIWISDDLSVIRAGSRNRWITPESDNFGFAKWVAANAQELLKLGPGHHYGEWWGQGIQRRYGLDHKRFSLFNTQRWADPAVRPACCHVVPLLAIGPQDRTVEVALERLRTEGSIAAPGFMDPEGVVVYHTAARSLFKVTCKDDATAKGNSEG